ncbi:Bug family tripartite tricarboxylate transporter substrate binding protein [Roseomonas sp. CCTCC AB2023176]|uniref:Bug family tripartite tricarboxylate transporter substrate binding protein n=1 Tax=Roseomonas sp. CCTCC AB2023176 TaxID=3342640 RepID=UPI0035DC378A
MTSRRTLLAALPASFGAGALSAPAIAQGSYPSRPIRVVVPFPAGGATDAQARAFAEALGQKLEARVVTENRPGAGGNLGAEAVMRSPADGYTLLATGPNLINTRYLVKDTPFQWERDFDPLGIMFTTDNVLAVHPSIPATNVAELVAHLKANPGKLNYGSAGTGGSIHLATLLFMRMTGTDMVHVPYRGDAPARTDLTAGRIQVMFNSAATSTESIRAGLWRGLATTGPTRLPQLPELPTLIEAGLDGYVVQSWMGLFGPKGLPAPVTGRIRQAFDAIFADPANRAGFERLDVAVAPTTAEEHLNIMRLHERTWAPILSTFDPQ